MEFQTADPERLSSAALRAQAEDLGYLFVRDLLPAEALLSVRRILLQQAADLAFLDPECEVSEGIARPGLQTPSYDDPRFVALQVGVQSRTEFDALREHSALITLLERCLGGPIQSRCGEVCRLAFPHSEEHTTRPHQDQAYYHQAGSGSWTAWMPLGDCPGSLGALRLIPTSHLAGLLPHGPGISGMVVPEDAAWAGSDFRLGDVLLFHPLTIHAAQHNQDPRRLRVSVDCRYRRQAGKAEAHLALTQLDPGISDELH